MLSTSQYRYRKIRSLWDFMKPFQPALFLSIVQMFEALSQQKQLGEHIIGRTLAPNALHAVYKENHDALFPVWERACKELELTASLITIERISTLVLKPNSTDAEMVVLGDELKGRIRDEMMGRVFYCLTVAETEHYVNWETGWKHITARFPQAVRDIEECRKTFALSRYAASIFHSLQIVEFGLVDLGKFIGVTDPKSGWTAVTGKLSNIINTPHKSRSRFVKKNFDFIEQTHATTAALKNAWRNKISHAQGRLVLLGSDFSPEVAEEIMIATRSFMGRLAEGLPAMKSSPVTAPLP